MALESSTTSTTSTRPSEWSYSSPDLNVLLSGHLVTPLPDTQAGAGQGQQSLEGAQFQLDTRGIYIEHPALVSITTTPTSQTLSSLNTGQPILTLSTPLLPPSTSPASSPTRTHTPTIITLHSPLLTRDQLASLQSSPLYSSTFHLLLDGPAFLPPKFDPHAIEPPPTPLVGPNSGQQHILNSPTLQRALLSPLLSPQRRAHSQGSDTSVPPLSLGLSRARAPSLSGGPSSSSNRTNINTAPPPTTLAATRGLEALLPPSTSRPSLDASLSSAISHAAKTTASEIMALRRSHAFYVKRAKLELHVLQTRVSNATNHAVAAPGGGLVVKGFRSASRSPGGGGGGAGETRRESLSREESRERSVERGSSEERGRARGVGGSKKDEKVSEGIRESDRREEEERGRSRSRVRRGGGGGGGGERAPSKTGKAVKEVIDAAAADRAHHSSSNTSSPALSPSKSTTTTTKPLSTGQSISAFIDDSAPSSPTTTTTTATSSSQPIPVATEEDDDAIEEEDAASPMFVPSSHALVSIPETEELSLPASEIGDEEQEEEAENEDEERKEEERARRGSALSGSEESSEEETDHPFEMDEDLDVDPLTLTFSSPSPPSFDAPTPSAPAPAPAQPTNTSTSFRPGSLARPSTLSASYNALLSSSLSSRPSHSHSHSPSLPPPSTSPYGTHPTSTSFTKAVQTALDFIPQPDRQAARVGEEKIRDVLAMDAPSHRRVLPSRRWAAGRRRRGSSGGFDEVEESDEEQEQEQEHEHEDRTSRMEIGSLPISIGFARPQPSSSFRPPGERELMRKTSVPGREGMFVPPLLNPKTKAPVLGGLTRRKSGKKDKEEEVGPEQGSKASQSQSLSSTQAQAMPLPSPSSKIDVTPSSTSSSAGLSSSLAQSLRAHPSQAGGGVRSFSQVVEEEEAEEAETPSKTGSEDGEAEEEGEDFVPPHEFVLRGRRDEEMLSRSVTSY